VEEQLREAQKLEAVGQLAAGVAHEFNNMLAVILGHTELMLHRMDATDAKRRDAIQIKRASERAAATVQKILAFGRRQMLSLQLVDLNAVVVSAKGILLPLLGEHTQLITDLDAALRLVRADPTHLTQALLNLALNAREAMPTGGRLTIRTRNVELTQSDLVRYPDLRAGTHAVMTVSDTGRGMDDATRSRAFEPFFTTKEVGQGAGLGLSTVYGIVRQLEGHVQVESAPGQGSVFTICLPVAAQVARPSPDGLAEWPQRGTETILLVDDDDMVRELAREALRMSGYTVLEARRGEEALQICEQQTGPIHLLLTDVMIPGMGGRDLARQAARLRPEMKRLFISADQDEQAARHRRREKRLPFVSKPFSPQALVQKVREVLE
jgi:two-component system cell cycle sensor histidine kinase/response regulator CckA